MQTSLQKKINNTLLSNRVFKKLDKVVRFDGKDTFEQWEQYYMKNLGKVTVPRYSELVLEVSNKVREKFNIPKSEHTYIWNKALEGNNFENDLGCMNIYYRIIQLKNQNLNNKINNKEISITTYFLLIFLLLLFIAIAYFFC